MSPMPIFAEVQWQALDLLPVSVIIVALGLALVIWLYLPQLRNKYRRWRWLVPTFRMGLILALAVAILRPVVIRPRGAGDATGIVVLVDQSASMSARDAYRSPADLVRQATALGWLQPGTADSPAQPRQFRHGFPFLTGTGIDQPDMPPPIAGSSPAATEAIELMRWLDRVQVLAENVGRTSGEMDYARFVSRGMESAQDRQIQASKSLQDVLSQVPGIAADNPEIASQIQSLQVMADKPITRTWLTDVRAALDQLYRLAEQRRAQADQLQYEQDASIRVQVSNLSTMSRLSLVQQALGDTRAGFLARLPADMHLWAYGFDEQLHPLHLEAGELFPGGSAEAVGDRTDLAGAVMQVLRQSRPMPLEAVIVFTDGRQTGTTTPMALSLSGLDVPVIAVQSAASRAMCDVVLSKLVVPGTLYPGQLLRVHAELTFIPPARGMTLVNPAVDVTIQAGDATHTKNVPLSATAPVSVDFELSVPQRGIVPVTVRAGTLSGEATDLNNQLTRRVKMLADGLRVGIYAGKSSRNDDPAMRDYLLLKEALLQAPWVTSSQGVLSAQSPLDLSPEQILQMDMLILFHVPADSLSTEQWQAVHRMVSQQGGCLVLVPGTEQWATEYLQSASLAQWLPFAPEELPAWRTWPGRQPGFGLLPAPQSDVHLLEPENPAEDQARWLELPGMARLMPLPKMRPGVTPLLVDRDSGMPVLVRLPVDEGRVLFLGCDQLWQWATPAGNPSAERFWRQLIRQEARSPFVANAGEWSMDVSQANVNPGQTISVRVNHVLTRHGNSLKQWVKSHWVDAAPSTIPSDPLADNLPGHGPAESLPKLVISRHGKILQTLPLQHGPDPDSGQFQVGFVASGAGDLELSLQDAGEGPLPVLTVQVIDPLERELANLTGDDTLPNRVARLSGGSVMGLEDVNRLPEKLAELRGARPIVVEDKLYNSAWLYAFILACLAAEWGLRKHMGMA